jgi:hypothetical protein
MKRTRQFIMRHVKPFRQTLNDARHNAACGKAIVGAATPANSVARYMLSIGRLSSNPPPSTAKER